jgi:tetratricopeptide (TPR) repeat protein
VTQDEQPHYRAFLSYSHADQAAADWLFRALERFPISKALTGQATTRGPIPARLYPIFKDRHEFPAGRDLAEETDKALGASAALIVLCSPHSATSVLVQREIARFQALHAGTRPIIPLILGGKPGQTVADWFPPPLTPDRLAADWRDDAGDGRELALAKVIAALLGLPPEQVYRRLERERKRLFWRRTQAAAAIVLLVAGGGYTTWKWFRSDEQVVLHQRSLAELEQLARNYLHVTNPAAAADVRTIDDLVRTFQRIDQAAAAGDARKAEVLNRVAAGDTAGALTLQEEIARDAATQAEVQARAEQAKTIAARKRAAEEYRTVARLAGYADPRRARAALAEALRLDPDDVTALSDLAELQVQAGALTEAETAYRRALALGQPGQHDRDIYWSQLGLGDVLRQRRNLSDAMAHYQDARAIAARLARADPANAGWQRDLSVSFTKIGDVLVAQGKGEEALAAFRDSHAIFERLARADPANAGWQRDLSISFNKVGDVLVAQGKGEEALAAFRDSREIRQRLARAFGTVDLSVIIARILRGLRIAEALENRLLRRKPTQEKPRVIRNRPPANPRPEHPRPAKPKPAEQPDDDLTLPSAQAIAARIKGRASGAVIVEICRELGINTMHPLWREIQDAIFVYRGSMARMMTAWMRIAAFGLGNGSINWPIPTATVWPEPAIATTGPP